MQKYVPLIGLGIMVILLAGMALFRFQPLLFPQFTIESVSGDVLFVGDVMLSRFVEERARAVGAEILFADAVPLFEKYKYSVGNLEGTVPEAHIPTPAYDFSFSIDANLLPALGQAGFTHMTLANNHAFDYGEKAYAHTQAVLEALGIDASGHPNRVTLADVATVIVDGRSVSIIPVSVFGGTDRADVSALLQSLETDVQIITIHWGEEYKLIANDKQKELARAFIDAGADGVIGHHPHVVENIETYKGVPIFYSLGNFIFDQYWNADVQQGLAVGMEIDAKEITYTLIPTVSEQSIVRVMDTDERDIFLDALARRSAEEMGREIRVGRFSFRYE